MVYKVGCSSSLFTVILIYGLLKYVFKYCVADIEIEFKALTG